MRNKIINKTIANRDLKLFTNRYYLTAAFPMFSCISDFQFLSSIVILNSGSSVLTSSRSDYYYVRI